MGNASSFALRPSSFSLLCFALLFSPVAFAQRPILDRTKERAAQAERAEASKLTTPFADGGRAEADLADPRRAAVDFSHEGATLTIALKFEPIEGTEGTVVRLMLGPGEHERALIPAGRWRVTMKAGLAGHGFVVLEPRDITIRRGGGYSCGTTRELEQAIWERIRNAERKRKERGDEKRAEDSETAPARRR